MNIKILKALLIIISVIILMPEKGISQDPPAGYTNNFRLRMWDEGDHPGADSVNQNLIDLDLHLYNRDNRIDSLKNAFGWMFNFPSGTFKRYASDEFDNDTLKVVPGVFAKLGIANTFLGLNKFQGGQMNFEQDFGTTLNFVYDNDLGGVFIKKNSSTDLLKFDEDDGLYWQMLYPLTVDGSVDITGQFKVNGVPISTGGGDVFQDNVNTFTDTNTFQGVTNFEGESQILNFNYDDDVGGVFIRKNSSTDLLRFDENNGLYWEFLYSQLVNGDINVTGQYKVNGVPVNIYGQYDSMNVTGTIYAGDFSGSGDLITGLDAGAIDKGTLTDSRLSSNVPLKNASNDFTAAQAFKNNVDFNGGHVISNMDIATSTTATIGTTVNYGLSFQTNSIQRGLIDTSGVLTWYGDIKFKKGSTAVFSTVDNFGINFRTNEIDRIRLDSAGVLRQASNNWFINSSGTMFLGSHLTSNGNITINNNVTPVNIRAGTGTPEGVVTANAGSMFLRTDGGAGTTLYIKESGTGNTGWVAK